MIEGPAADVLAAAPDQSSSLIASPELYSTNRSPIPSGDEAMPSSKIQASAVKSCPGHSCVAEVVSVGGRKSYDFSDW